MTRPKIPNLKKMSNQEIWDSQLKWRVMEPTVKQTKESLEMREALRSLFRAEELKGY